MTPGVPDIQRDRSQRVQVFVRRTGADQGLRPGRELVSVGSMDSGVASEVASGDQAAAMLEKVKALPVRERETFTKLFHHWEAAGDETPQGGEKPQWPDFAGRIKAIFGEREIPGDPQEFWDEERGR